MHIAQRGGAIICWPLSRSLARSHCSIWNSLPPRVDVSLVRKIEKHCKFQRSRNGRCYEIQTKLIYSNNLHVLSLNAIECMCDESETTSSSHHTLAGTSSCRQSLSRPHPPSPAPHPQSSAIIRNHPQSSPALARPADDLGREQLNGGREAELPDRALCLPTFNHLLIVNKTSLFLSLPPSLPPSRSLSLSLSAKFLQTCRLTFNSVLRPAPPRWRHEYLYVYMYM
jgi:hypothetical protein